MWLSPENLLWSISTRNASVLQIHSMQYPNLFSNKKFHVLTQITLFRNNHVFPSVCYVTVVEIII